MYLPDTGHLFMVHKSLDLWISRVTTWMSERGLAPTPAAGAQTVAPTAEPAAPTPQTTPPAPAAVPVSQPVAAPAAAAPCVVPSLKKLTVAQATAKLAKAGCELGRTSYRTTKAVRAGRIVKQNHSAKARLRAGARVNITVARR
jgi:hypothetical protein